MQLSKTLQKFAASLVVFLFGCLSVQNIETPAEVQTAAASTDRSIVYGRMRWIENGQEPSLESENFFGERIQSISPRMKRAEDNSTVTVGLNNAGHFVWSLREGTYIFDELTFVMPENETVSFLAKGDVPSSRVR